MTSSSPSLYEILGIAQSATLEEVTRAYRKLARKHHPDRAGDPETFKKVQFAYDVLSDPERRSHYDATGEADSVVDTQASEIAGLLSRAMFIAVKHMLEKNMDLKSEDVIAFMDKGLANTIQEDQQNKIKLASVIAAYQEASPRFETKDSKENLLAQVAQAHAQKAQAEMDKLLHQMEMTLKAREVLKGYKYRHLAKLTAKWTGWTATTTSRPWTL